MEYKIGFLYNLPQRTPHRNHLLLTFEQDHFSFRLIDPRLIPKFRNTCVFDNSLDYPVLYSETLSGEITKLHLLSDLPIQFHSDSPQQGIALSIPFWEFPKTNNPCNRTSLTTGTRCSNQISSINILLDGKELIVATENDWWLLHTDFYSFFPRIFSWIVITYFVICKIVSSIQYDCYRIGSQINLPNYLYDELEHRFYQPKNREDFFLNSIQKAKSYIDSFNIQEILSDLSVEVTEHFYHKVGDDDSYFVSRTAILSSPIANNDRYLKNIIGLGEQCIHSDRGYCSAESMKIRGLLTGVYTGQALETEKQRIISNYSKESHLGFLLSEIFSTLMKNQSDLRGWEVLRHKYREILIKYFHIDMLFNTDRRFEKNFYPLEDPHIKNPQTIVDSINQKICEKTKCCLTKEVCVRLYNEKFPTQYSCHDFSLDLDLR